MEREDFNLDALQIEQQVERLQSIADPAARAIAEDLIASILELHAAALRSMLAKLRELAPDASAILAAFDRDDLVRSLLLLHDLHPQLISDRVNQAIKELRPRMEKYGATAAVIGADQEVISVLIHRASPGCGSTVEGIRSLVYDALLNAAPDVGRIVVELAGADSDFVAVSSIQCASSGPSGASLELPLSPVTLPNRSKQ